MFFDNSEMMKKTMIKKTKAAGLVPVVVFHQSNCIFSFLGQDNAA